MFKRAWWLNSTACFAPPERAGAAPAAAADDDLDLELDDADAGDDDNAGDDSDDSDDGGADDAGAGDDADADADPAGVAEPVRRRAADPADGDRAERNAGRANSEIRHLRAEKQDMQRRLDEIEQRSQQRQQPLVPPAPAGLTAQQEAELLSTMTVEERMEFKLNKALKATEAQNQQFFRNVQDQNDSVGFKAELERLPKLKRFEADVEKRYREVISSGGYLPRKAILIYVLGEKTLEKQSSGHPARRAGAGPARVARQQARSSNGRNDVPAQRRQGGRTLEERLDNVQL